MRIITYPNCFKKTTIMKWKCGGCSWYVRCWYDIDTNENVDNEVGQ